MSSCLVRRRPDRWQLRSAVVGDVGGPEQRDIRPPPAWYRDPWGVAPLRWWDGGTWTAFTSLDALTSPVPPLAAPAQPDPQVARATTTTERPMRRRLVAEILIVLAIFPLPYVLNALAVLAQAAVHQGAPGRFPLPIAGHLPLSFLIDLVLTLEPLAAAALVLYLLSISGERGGRAIGLDRSDARQDLALVLPVFLLCFLLPEGGVARLLHAAHVRSITPATQKLPGYYSIVGVATAVSAGVVEEIVVLGFLVRRLEQLGLRPALVVAVAVLVRISYHLYYGWGVLPILAWALASVLMYRRYRRLGPFIVVHTLWDLGLILVPFFGGGPLTVEVLLLAPSTFVAWLMWRNRIAPRPPAPQSNPGWRAG